MSADGFSSSTALINSDTQIVPLGKVVRVFVLHLRGGAGGATQILLSSGGSGGTVYIDQLATAVSQGDTFNYGPQGIVFPSGLYANVDANIVTAAITYRVE